VAAGGPLGPVQLHHLLGVGVQEAGQAGTVAAGAFDRPHPLALMAASRLQQLLVAGRGRRNVTCSRTAPVAAFTTAAVWVSLWVSTPTGELDEVCQHGHALTPCPDVDVTGLVRTGRTARL
jgi:hypothetical protein